MHYQRVMRHGSPEKPGRDHLRTDPSLRLWAKVDKDGPTPPLRPDLGPCWVWTGSTDRNGYGYFRINKEVVVLAHRFTYEEQNGSIPDGKEIDHLCRNRACVRPSHLEAVTRLKNVQRGFSPSTVTAATGICRRGHAMTVDNVYVAPDGGRRCRRCIRERQQRWAKERKARQ